MAFTTKDRAELARARRIVEDLETKEQEAISGVIRAMQAAGLDTRPHESWAAVCMCADAIRDALEPFDSGVRPAQDQSE